MKQDKGSIDWQKIKKVHFIGVGGIGLSAIAKLAKTEGKIVSGSDTNRSEITDSLEGLGVKISIGQREENLDEDADLVIYTLAIPETNPELAKAKKFGIPLLTYPEALGRLFNDKYGIAICGTHGKSTTTSMVGLLLAAGGLDPSVVVGTKVPEFSGNLRIGKSDRMVIEACEYERAFMEYWPKIILLNNIELDHTDYYKDIDDYRSAFEDFIGHLSQDGILILNGDDIESQKLKIKDQRCRSKIRNISFGSNFGNDLQGYDIETGKGKMKFKARYLGKELGEFVLKIPGKFNVYNALGAMAVALSLGVSPNKIRESLASFGGIWRRFEIKGSYEGALVVSDYAHHPTAVRSTIEAARGFYPDKRIVAVFQPHQHNRTKELYKDFLDSFDAADIVILCEIFDVAGREKKEDQNVSSQDLVRDIGEKNHELKENIFYAKNLEETKKLIDRMIRKDDVLLIMGAGDIYKLANDLTKEKEA